MIKKKNSQKPTFSPTEMIYILRGSEQTTKGEGLCRTSPHRSTEYRRTYVSCVRRLFIGFGHEYVILSVVSKDVTTCYEWQEVVT